jgi:SulP family sulfate permease
MTGPAADVSHPGEDRRKTRGRAQVDHVQFLPPGRRVSPRRLAIPSLGDLSGGLSAALVVLPTILSCGAVSYQTLGPDYVARGVTAAFMAAIVAGIVAWLFDGPVMHINSPKTIHAALLSLLMVQVAALTQQPMVLIGIASAALALSGLLQMVLGGLRLGRVVRLLPRPVLAGLVNGFALQIVLTQLPRMFGAETLSGLGQGPPLWALALAAIAAIVTLLGRKQRLVPPPLLGLAAGTGLALTLKVPFGPSIGFISIDTETFSSLKDVLRHADTAMIGPALLPVLQTAVTLALVSSIQSLLNIASGDTITGVRHDPGRVVIVQGASNLLAACSGGTPIGGSISTTQAAFAAGARSRAANLSHVLSLVLLLAFCRGAIAVIPLSVMAAVVIVTTIGSMDGWSLTLLRRAAVHEPGKAELRRWLDLATVVMVAVLVPQAGVLLALTVGFAITTFSFLGRTVQVFIRSVTYDDTGRSRTTRDPERTEALRREGSRIAVLALQGPLYFATAEYLLDRIEQFDPHVDFVILDLRNVSDTDITGVFALRRAHTLLAAGGRALFIAGLPVTPRLRSMFAEAGLPVDAGWRFDTLQEALSEAEDALLQRLGLAAGNTEEKGFAAILGPLSDADAAMLMRHTTRRAYPPGAVILREGDPGDAAYLLVTGEIKVIGQQALLGRYCAGTVFGEMALLTGQARFANVEASTAVVVQELSAEALTRISVENPQLACAILRAIGRQLSARVSDLSRTVAALGG